MLGFGKAFPVNILWIWKLDFESKTLLNFGVGKDSWEYQENKQMDCRTNQSKILLGECCFGNVFKMWQAQTLIFRKHYAKNKLP